MQIPRKKCWRPGIKRESYLITTGMVNTVFLMKSTVKLLFWRGQITSPYFLRATDQKNGLAPLEKPDILDFENRHFCSLKRLIFDLQQYSILFLALFSSTINKEQFFFVYQNHGWTPLEKSIFGTLKHHSTFFQALISFL